MDVMTRRTGTFVPRLAVVAGAVLALMAAPALAAPPCAQRVIDDWSDNGRVDGTYRLQCYEQALDAIPVDLRDYTNAADVIERALSAAARQGPPGGGSGGRSVGDSAFEEIAPTVEASASSLPLVLIVLVAVSLLVLGAGALGHFARRRRSVPPSD